MKQLLLKLSVSAVLALSLCTGISEAAVSPYDKAVNTYLADEYEKALPMFQALAKTDPKNPKVHYYLALCYQMQDDVKKAVDEYNLALKEVKDPAFKEILEARLRKAQLRAGMPVSAAEAPKSAQKSKAPVRKVIWFSTNWCGVCKRFEPSWNEVKSKFAGKVVFEHLNAEDPANWKAVEAYKPKAYPTLVYLDAKNNVIDNGPDAPSIDVFSKRLKDYGAK